MSDFDNAKSRLREASHGYGPDQEVLWFLTGYLATNEAFCKAFADRVNEVLPKEATTMEIELKEVQSSNITHIGYDAATKTLIVKFKGSGKYSYAGVPQEKYDALMLAESKGKYFASEIRNAKDADGHSLHVGTKVEEKAEEPVAV